MPTCPICRNPHDTYGGVAVHIWKKEDEAHDMAESKDDALIWLSENGHIAGDTSDDTEPSPEPDTSPGPSTDTSEPATTDGGESVEFPEAPESNEPDPVDESDPDCPGCQPGDVVDATEMMRRRPDLSADHMELLRESDYACVQCGGVFDDE